MKVTSVSVTHVTLPRMAEGAAHAPLVLRAETDQGIAGAGEIGLAYGLGGRAAAELAVELARAFVLGADPMHITPIVDRMTRRTFWGTAGGAIFGAAVSALDIALHDIKARALGVPVHVLLGGACRDRIRLYCNGWYRSLAAPAAYAEAALGVRARGFDALKFDPMKLGADGVSAHPDRTIEPELERLAAGRVAAVREAVGEEMDILVELHGNMWPAASIAFFHRIAAHRPFCLEEPADPQNAEATALVARAVTCPVAAGERLCTPYDFRRFLALGALGLAQPDMGIAGGFSGVAAIAAVAAAHDVGLQPHNCGGPLSTAACVQLSFAIPNFVIQEIFPVWPDERLRIVTDPFESRIVGGHLPRPDAPGLGVEPDLGFLARFPTLTA